MITIKNTPNLTGVTISGDYNDLYNLVEALHDITINDRSGKHYEYIDISTRVLGVCYDTREYQCEPGAIKLQGIEFPEHFEW